MGDLRVRRLLFRSQEGLTLIELIIVLAIIAIIGAIIVPNFLVTTDRARLKSDIQSAKTIQSAVALYHAEQGESLDSFNIENILTKLHATGYIKETKADETQTPGAKWVYEVPPGSSAGAEKSILVDISKGVDARITNEIYSNLTADEKKWVKTGAGP